MTDLTVPTDDLWVEAFGLRDNIKCLKAKLEARREVGAGTPELKDIARQITLAMNDESAIEAEIERRGQDEDQENAA